MGPPRGRPRAVTPGDRRRLEFVDLYDRKDPALLRGFHRSVYLPAFPIESERESLATWRDLLWGSDRSCELHVLLAGFDLGDPRRRRLIGGHIFEYYPEASCGLLTYLVIHPSHRGRGLASHLFRRGILTLKRVARRRHRRLRLVFAEVNDPRKVSRRSDVMDPWARLAFFGRLGGRVLDLPYVQPELEPGQGPARNLLLLTVFPDMARRRSIEARPVRRFLAEFYRAVDIRHPETDADFRKMAAAMKNDRVSFRRIVRP
jgi:GNAT superfamily N-acetyltransferase